MDEAAAALDTCRPRVVVTYAEAGGWGRAIVLESRRRGIPTVGFWARVPHYVAGIYHPAVVTLVERVSRYLGVELPLADLVQSATDQRRQLDTALAEQANVKEIVSHLEELYDASGEVASGEEIAAEIERYLRDRGPDDDI
jgi:hypothetical protein